jgi:hypothetical protein
MERSVNGSQYEFVVVMTGSIPASMCGIIVVESARKP